MQRLDVKGQLMKMVTHRATILSNSKPAMPPLARECGLLSPSVDLDGFCAGTLSSSRTCGESIYSLAPGGDIDNLGESWPIFLGICTCSRVLVRGRSLPAFAKRCFNFLYLLTFLAFRANSFSFAFFLSCDEVFACANRSRLNPCRGAGFFIVLNVLSMCCNKIGPTHEAQATLKSTSRVGLILV